MKFFDYLSTTADQNRFIVAALIGWCVLEALSVAYKGWSSRKLQG